MGIKRLTSEGQRNKLQQLKKFSQKKFSQLSNADKDELLKIVAEQLNLIQKD